MKIYEKPDVEYVSLVAEENIATDDNGPGIGLGVESAGNIKW